MDYEFDKEIDALLRQSAQGEAVFASANPPSAIRHPPSAHLDADELAAFAENALPEKTRQTAMRHLADCDDCRTNLAALIRLNGDERSEAVHAADEKFLIAAPIPWYRKLFAVPNPVYAMGALVLVFSGIVGYTLLQNSQNAEVSQVSEKQTGGKGMSSDGDQPTSESFSAGNANLAVSNAMSSNTAANTAMPMMPAAPAPAVNSNQAMLRETDKDQPAAPTPAAPAKEAAPLNKLDDLPAGIAPTPPPPAENEYTTSDNVASQSQTQSPNIQNQIELMPDSRNAKRSQVPAPQVSNKRKSAEMRDDAAEEKSKIAATTSVGGKTFRRENNVWYDQTYRGQPTTNVSRGTDQYKKLDSGLRAVAENLGGTVVIVWKSKAYRIQ